MDVSTLQYAVRCMARYAADQAMQVYTDPADVQRIEKGLGLVLKGKCRHDANGGWVVESDTRPQDYGVAPACVCEDTKRHGLRCKHRYATAIQACVEDMLTGARCVRNVETGEYGIGFRRTGRAAMLFLSLEDTQGNGGMIVDVEDATALQMASHI